MRSLSALNEKGIITNVGNYSNYSRKKERKKRKKLNRTQPEAIAA